MNKKETITITDRFIYNLIDSYSKNKKEFYGSNKYLAESLNKSQSVISHSISRLLKHGYLLNKGNKMGRRLFTTDKVLLNTSLGNADNNKESADNNKESADFDKESADFDKESADNNFFLEQFKKEFAKNSNNKMLKSAIESADNSYILIKILISYTNSVIDGTPKKQKINHDSDFNLFWDKYPRRIGKAQSLKSFSKAIKETSLNDILTGLEKYKLWLQKNHTEEQFIKHPSTWLNQKCYLDDYGFDKVNPIATRELHGLEKLAIEENRELSFLEKKIVNEWLKEGGIDEVIC